MSKSIRVCVILIAINLITMLCSCSQSTSKGGAEDVATVMNSINSEIKQKMSGTLKLTLANKETSLDENEALISIAHPVYATVTTMLSDIDIVNYPLTFEYITDGEKLSLYTKCNNDELNIVKISDTEAFINTEAFMRLMQEQSDSSMKEYKWVKTPIKMTSDLAFKLPDGSLEDIIQNVMITKGSNQKNGNYIEYSVELTKNALLRLTIENTNITETISITHYENTNSYRIIDVIDIPDVLELEAEYNYNFDKIEIEKPDKQEVYSKERVSD